MWKKDNDIGQKVATFHSLFVDFDTAADTAPFNVDDEFLKVPTNEERIAVSLSICIKIDDTLIG